MSLPASITPRETILQTRTCGGGFNPTPCGHDVDVKANKNGIAYYYCHWCSHHQKWGRADSQKLIQLYLKSRRGSADPERHIVTDLTKKRQPAPAAPAPKKEPANVFATPEPANSNRSPDDGRHWLFGT